MSIESLTTEDKIRAACMYMTSLSPNAGDRLRSAEALLLRGGWARDGAAVQFPGGVTATEHSCTCPEGGRIECLHMLANRMLAIVDRF